MIISDNTDVAISVLADYHEDNGNYQQADTLREELQNPARNDWTWEAPGLDARTPVAWPACYTHVGDGNRATYIYTFANAVGTPLNLYSIPNRHASLDPNRVGSLVPY